MLLPFSATSIVGNRIAKRMLDRTGPAMLLPVGCVAFGAANVVLAGWHSSVWQLVAAMTVGGLGSGLVFNAIPQLLVREVPAAETGSAMAFNIVLRFLGFSFGSAGSLALLEHFAVRSLPTETGFVAVARVGLGISCLAGVVCLGLAVASARRQGNGR